MLARILTGSVALATLVALASSAGTAAASASPASDPGHHSLVVPTSDHGRGAAVPFTEYSAVGSQTNGTVIGPSYNLYTLADEAVGRTAVTLSGAGRYVDFTLARPANAVDLRYSIPDSADGAGLTTPLKVYVNGQERPDLTLTSDFDWFYGSYPFTNNPADLHGHHMYDDVRTLFGATLPAGTQIRFEIANPSVPVTINVADFQEVAPPAPQPRGSISVLSYGADPTGQTDSTTAIQNAINAGSAEGKAVYIPPGNYTVTAHLIVNNVTLTGAGEWYSVLGGNGVGVFGNLPPNPSTNVHLSNFAIYGQVQARVDSDDFMGIGGALQDSTISNVWIQHVQAGIWMTGPFSNLTISNVRIQDTVADGINFDGGVTHSSVTNTYIRNTGDDGIALWSSGPADSNDVVSHDTVVLPVLANNFAIYGGSDNSITHDYGTDTITQGGGIQVGNRFSSVPLSGTTTIADNTLVRTGTLDPNWRFGVGAIWFYASDSENMTGTINVEHNTILDSPYDAFGFVGDYIPGATPPAYAIDNVNINDNIVRNVGTFVFQLQSAGSDDTISNVVASGVGMDGQMACAYGITPTYGAGNSGWSGSECAFPPFDYLSTSASSLDFGLVNLNTQSPSQSVTITNPGPDAASISSVYATNGFAETNNCPASLAVGASCTATVTITPAAVQQYQGNLVFDASPANNPFAPYVVSLSAAVYNPNGNLALTATASADNTLAGFPAGNANDGNQATYWQAANGTGVLTLALAKPAPVDRVVLELPQGWGDRDQTIEVDGSTDGSTWTTLVPSATYLFSANNADGNNVVTISIPADPTVSYLRLDVSNNTVQGAPQIAEFEVFSN
ncbi:MAG TPA: glycosyl hydrolase family 28-related protein [Streptosporangiaceae bacterium]|nr:glycosyl hydrolase family 28-related protein [Streptosporangiaceae bacterium]